MSLKVDVNQPDRMIKIIGLHTQPLQIKVNCRTMETKSTCI